MPSAHVQAGTGPRGYCRRLRAWLAELDCRQYRRPESRYSGRPLKLNLGCQDCPGLEWEAPSGGPE